MWHTKFICVKGTWLGMEITSDDGKIYKICARCSRQPWYGYFQLCNITEDWYIITRMVILNLSN